MSPLGMIPAKLEPIGKLSLQSGKSRSRDGKVDNKSGKVGECQASQNRCGVENVTVKLKKSAAG